jgi:D-amino-acid dehydrogenase
LRATAALAATAFKLYDEYVSEGIQFEMAKSGLLFASIEEHGAEHLLMDTRDIREQGYELPSLLDGDQMRRAEPWLSDRVRSGFIMAAERHVDPRTLLAGLTTHLSHVGVPIYEHARVTEFRKSGGEIDFIIVNGKQVPADFVVISTGAWSTRLLARHGVRIPMLAGKGYSFSISGNRLPSRPIYLIESKVGLTPMAGRLRVAGTMELSGVNTHLDRRRIEAMRIGAAQFLRGVDWASRSEDWVGMRPIVADGLPIIDRLPGVSNAFVAIGHSMLGITLGPSTGHALADMIASGHKPSVLEPFSFGRLGN